MTITIVHGGQTGVDRGAHEVAIANGWSLAGYMPSDKRDERGPIPEDVARFLVPHNKAGYGARTEANVRAAHAVLIIVRDADEPRATPGTSKTIDLAAQRNLPGRIVDPATDVPQLASWIWRVLLMPCTLMLPLDGLQIEPAPTRLLIAGPRESKWPGAQVETAALLRRIALAIVEIRSPKSDRDLPQEPR